MLSNVMRIIQKIAPTSTLTLGWAHWSFGWISKLWLLLAIYQGQFSKYYFIKKKAYGKYLPYATLGGYVLCLGAEVFKFPCRLILGRFSAEDEQKPKLVSAHPQISLWLQKSVMMWNSTFFYNNLSLCYSDIPNRVTRAICNITIT